MISAQALLGERELLALEPVGLQLLRDEVALGDAELLFLGVARELDHVHPVEERRRNRVELVRGADEEHLREVERKVEIVVAEGRVLLGIEHLEHRARGVAAEVGAHLVDLVDQEHRVLRLGVAQGPDDRSGHGADVRAPVPADLGLVADASDRDADELATQRARDRLAERRLADSGRADEAEDRPREVVLQLRDREVLEDPLLDLVEVEVVLVEDLARAHEIEVVLGHLVPGEAEDPFDVGADDAVLGRRRRQLLEPGELAVDCLAGFFGEVELGGAVAELLELGLLGVALAELVLNRLQLLPQEVLALRRLHLGHDLRLDLRAELGDLELAIEDHEHRAEALLDVGQLEQLLLLLGLQPKRGGDEVAERARLVDVGSGERELLGQVRHEPDQARKEGLDVLLQRLGLGAIPRRRPEPPRTGRRGTARPGPGRRGGSGGCPGRGRAASRRDADHLLHDRGGADLVQVVPAGLLDARGPSRPRGRSSGRSRRPRPPA